MNDPMVKSHPATPGSDESGGWRVPVGGLELAAREQGDGPTVLLVHSINAAAGMHEVRPIHDRLARTRRAVSVDLPGFGAATRGPADYSIALYVEAILAAVASIRKRHGGAPIDAVGLSLSCEFLARAALRDPAAFRSLSFVNPTGFQAGSDELRGEEGGHRGRAWLESALTAPLWRGGLYRALVIRPSVAFFLRRAFGSSAVDPGLIADAHAAAHHPGAEFAPLAFLSGKLFSADIRTVYEKLTLPVWLAHGRHGAFSDFSEAAWVMERPNWTVSPFETGAFPHFQAPDEFMPRLEAFLAAPAADAAAPGTGSRAAVPAALR